MSSHLDDQVAAFVDGQLDYARREKALEHLSGCAHCRAAVDHERWVKTRVQTLPGAEPSAALLSSLARVTVQPSPVDARAASWSPPRSRVRRGGLLAAGAGSVAAGVLGVAYVVGGAGAAQPDPVSPPVGEFSAEFAGTEQPMPFDDPAMDAFTVIGDDTTTGRP